MNAPNPPGRDAWARNMVAVYAAMIEGRHTFAQATYGDGEWKNILGTGDGTNDQGEAFCEELGAALRHTLLEPAGQWCVFWWGGAGADTHRQAQKWLAEHDPPVSWIPFRPLATAGIIGQLAAFFRAARTRRVVLVGPGHMDRLPPDVLNPAAHIPVPDHTAWQAVDETCEAVREAIRPDDLVCFSSGQASCLAIHRLWPECKPLGVTLLDTGALFDPYAGIYSRRYMRDETWRANVMPRNVPAP